MAAASQLLLPDTANAILHIPDPSYNLSCVHGTPAHLTFFLILFMFFILTPLKITPSLQTITSFILLSDGVLIPRSQAVSQRRKTIWLTIREAQLSPHGKGSFSKQVYTC